MYLLGPKKGGISWAAPNLPVAHICSGRGYCRIFLSLPLSAVGQEMLSCWHQPFKIEETFHAYDDELAR
jgi:hypothetical protein